MLADVVLVGFWVQEPQVLLQNGIRVPRILKELGVVLHIIYAGEYFIEIAQSELFFFEVNDHLQVLLRVYPHLLHNFG